jgi:hypothetical protein
MRNSRKVALFEFALLFAFASPSCHHVGGSSGAGIFGTQVRVQGVARFLDVDMDGTASQGDEIILGFDADVRLNSADPSELLLPVSGDAFGAGAAMLAGPGPNEVTVVLGIGATIRTRGTYSAGSESPGMASGVDVSAQMTPNAIENATTGVDAGPSPSGPLDLVPGFVDGGELVPEPAFAPSAGAGAGTSANTVATSDVNLDGRPDVITGYGDGSFLVQFGDGTGFGPGIQYTNMSGSSVSRSSTCPRAPRPPWNLRIVTGTV